MSTLLYLTFGGDVKLDTFEIQDSCSSWFHSNITAVEKQKKTFMRNHYYHEYKGKKYTRSYIGGAAFDHEIKKFEDTETYEMWKLYRKDRVAYFKKYHKI